MKEDASEVVVYDNENGKMLRSHALLCVHARDRKPLSFTIVRTCMP